MIRAYRVKPAIVQAVQYDGSNLNEIREWAYHNIFIEDNDRYHNMGDVHVEAIVKLRSENGIVRVRKGDFIVKHNDKFSICKPREFKKLYERT